MPTEHDNFPQRRLYRRKQNLRFYTMKIVSKNKIKIGIYPFNRVYFKNKKVPRKEKHSYLQNLVYSGGRK